MNILEIDSTILNVFRGVVECTEVSTSALISRERLELLGYDEFFGHKCVRVCPSCLSRTDEYYLLPAACLNMHEHLPALGTANTSDTLLTKVYRKEEYYDNTRKLEFTVREYVFCGSRDYVYSNLDLFERVGIRLVSRIGKVGQVATTK